MQLTKMMRGQKMLSVKMQHIFCQRGFWASRFRLRPKNLKNFYIYDNFFRLLSQCWLRHCSSNYGLKCEIPMYTYPSKWPPFWNFSQLSFLLTSLNIPAKKSPFRKNLDTLPFQGKVVHHGYVTLKIMSPT